MAWELLLSIRVSRDEPFNRAMLIASTGLGSGVIWKVAHMTSLNCLCLSASPRSADNSIS